MKLSDVGILKVGNTIQLAGGVWAGEGKMFLCLFPGEHGDVSVDGSSVLFRREEGGIIDDEGVDVVPLNMSVEEWQQFVRQTDVMETEIMAKARSGELTKIVARKSSRQIEQSVSWRVFKRDGYACRYCGRDDVPLTVDHLVRWEEGGPSTFENLLSACRKCNRTRGDMSYQDWLQSPYYERFAAGLKPGVRDSNMAVAATLADIPRKVHVHTR